jgi:osmoprotectant transport system permease protein
MSGVGFKAYRFFLFLVLFLAGVEAQRIGLVDHLSDPYELQYLVGLTKQHLYLVAVSMLLATATGVGLGILVSRKRFRRYAGIVMYVVGLGQTIPSLAVLALVMAFLGVGSNSAIFALFVYSTLPIARNTLAGLLAVPPSYVDAAKGLGMAPMRILWEIELPNATGVMLTGFRIALVINIGTAALGYLIGAGGLGDLIFTGISLMSPDKLLAGAIPVTLLALIGDYLCEFLGLIIVPKGLRLHS